MNKRETAYHSSVKLSKPITTPKSIDLPPHLLEHVNQVIRMSEIKRKYSPDIFSELFMGDGTVMVNQETIDFMKKHKLFKSEIK